MTSVPAAGAGLSADDPFQAQTFEEFKDRSEALFFARKLAAKLGGIEEAKRAISALAQLSD